MALDRTGLIEQLERLGDGDDAAVLVAARAAHRKAVESGLSWSELIRADQVEEEQSPVDDTSPGQTISDPGTTDVGRLIDRLIRKGVSDSLREDLADMKRQLNEGALDPEDARYVRALARRLGV
jgi:hypothetical protein